MDKSFLLNSLKQQSFSKRILNAFQKVSRENFISPTLIHRAYEDRPLPIGQGQTISQPYTIAVMLDLLKLKSGQKVLELGSGSGYVLALISEIVGETGQIYGVEIIKKLAEDSKKNLKLYKNIKIFNSDGKKGLFKYSPFDRILISAACEKIPEQVLNQLSPNGLIVAPIDSFGNQTITVLKKIKKSFKIIQQIPGFIFV